MADLITTSEYKTYASITSTTQDAQIALIITNISAVVRTYCNREFTTFYATDKVEYHDGGDSLLILQELPIISITSVERSYDNGATYSTLNEFTDYVIKDKYGAIQASSTLSDNNNYPFINEVVVSSSNGPIFNKALNGYKVTYKGGYATCPADLKLAVLDLVGYYMRSDMSVKSTRLAGSVGSATLEYVTTSNFPSHIRRILDMYKLEA